MVRRIGGPDKLRDMKELFLVEAAKYNVFPLDNDFLQRITTPRPNATAGQTVFTYSGEMSGLPDADDAEIHRDHPCRARGRHHHAGYRQLLRREING
jgi:hypothetical protein